MKKQLVYPLGLLVILLTIGVVAVFASSSPPPHGYESVYGLGYSANGKDLYVATDNGLNLYRKEEWFSARAETHAYMGFAMTKNNLYSSGMAAKDSDMKSPLGIIRSSDNGESFVVLGLQGENYFQGLTVGFETESIFVYNSKANSKMKDTGIYYSLDNAKSWKKSKMVGLSGNIASIDAHPTNENIVAVGTSEGLFLSENRGDTFKALSANTNVTAVSFDHANNILAGTYKKNAKLMSFNLDTKSIQIIPIPSKSLAPIYFIKTNPKNRNVIAVSTQTKDILLTMDNGENWKTIAKSKQQKK